MRKIFAVVAFLLLSFPVLLRAQSDNTVYVKNFPGSTVGQMAAADRHADRGGSALLPRRGLPPALLREARRRRLRDDAPLVPC